MKRRRVLRRGLGIVTLALAGCTGDEGTPTGSETPTPSRTTTATGTPTKPPTESSTETASRTPTRTSTETLGGTPPETRSDVPDGTPTETGTDTPGPTTNGIPKADATVVVGPNGALRFGPAEFEISAGDTVRWE